MTYDLLVGDASYSSWSLRAWLLFERFEMPVRVHWTELYSPRLAEDLKNWFPAVTVPVVRAASGALWTDTLAIVEGLVEENPEIPLLPKASGPRAAARSMIAEMHSSFSALRGNCPMNLRHGWSNFTPSDPVMADVARICTLWEHARGFGLEGPWLFGSYSAVDAYYAPVAARIAGYGLKVDGFANDYVARHLADPAFRRWRAMGEARNRTLSVYDQGLPHVPWPGPAAQPAKAVETGTAENISCPYSGEAPSHLMDVGGRVFGFCNSFCRDKTMADPEAWPAFMKVYQS